MAVILHLTNTYENVFFIIYSSWPTDCRLDLWIHHRQTHDIPTNCSGHFRPARVGRSGLLWKHHGSCHQILCQQDQSIRSPCLGNFPLFIFTRWEFCPNVCLLMKYHLWSSVCLIIVRVYFLLSDSRYGCRVCQDCNSAITQACQHARYEVHCQARWVIML